MVVVVVMIVEVVSEVGMVVVLPVNLADRRIGMAGLIDLWDCSPNECGPVMDRPAALALVNRSLGNSSVSCHVWVPFIYNGPMVDTRLDVDTILYESLDHDYQQFLLCTRD